MDWIDLVEAGYSQRSGLEAWLEELADRSYALLDAGVGIAVQAFEAGPGRFESSHVVARGPAADQMATQVREMHRGASPEGIARVLQGGTRAGTMSQQIFSAVPAERSFYAQAGISDVLGLVALTGDGAGIAISAPLQTERGLTSTESRWLGRVATHIGAGWRLRRALGRRKPSEAFAVFDEQGRPESLDASVSGEGESALRRAVVDAQAARSGSVRADPERSLELWRGLVDGRWSLVDRVREGGQRYIVAVENRQALADPRGLSPREREVAEWIGLGQADKEIAYTLGVSESAVANAAARARRKLHVATRAELAALFAPGGLRARLVECEIAGESLAVAALSLLDGDRLAELTDAEREVALLALAGHTNAAIAASRKSSIHTIANQLQAVYRKLGVVTRAELAASLQRPAES